MNEVHPEPHVQAPPRRSLRTGWKCLIVFIAAVIGAIIVHHLEGRAAPDASTYVARILGGAFGYFAIAMLVAAFIRGSSGAITGVVIVGVWAYMAYLGGKPERDALKAIDKHQKAINEAARSSLERSGAMNVDPSLIRNALNDVSAKAKAVDPQTGSAMEVLVSVTSEMIKLAEEGRKIWSEIATAEFQNPTSLRTAANIDGRLQRLFAFREVAERLLAIYPDLDVRLKTELSRRNLPPLKIKALTGSYIQGAHLDIAIPLSRSNVEFADVLIHKFQLLKTQLGAWNVRDNNIYFNDDSALRDWNDSSRRLFQIAEQRESLERKLLAAREAESK